MERYLAIDPGKFACKFAEYIHSEDRVERNWFETKSSIGDFRDDAIEKNTCIIEIEGETYKVGAGASGEGAELDTSKLTMLHKIAVITAMAKVASDNEEDVFNIAVGIPALPWHNVETREQAKAFLIPDKKITVKYKENSNSAIVEKSFSVKSRFVYPESIGALFMDDSPKISSTSTIGVLDIGSLNCNATLWSGNLELISDASITDELGGSILIQDLSQQLSSQFSRCDERLVSKILLQKPENRHLYPNNNDIAVIEESKNVIKQCLLDHVKKIKRCCDGRRWSLDYMTLIAIGGTSRVLAEELTEVFGENIVILDEVSFCNVLGYLRMLCSKMPEIGKTIPLDSEPKKKGKAA